jgi:hypothetical protein
MGRRKVDPANRLRAARACQPCKTSKKRCNAHWPCSNCLRRGIQSQCVYDETSHHEAPQSRPSNPITPPDVVVADGQNISPSHLIGSLATPHQSSQNGQQQEAVPTPPIPTHETVPSSPEIRHQLHPRLLRDGHGERGQQTLSIELQSFLLTQRGHSIHRFLGLVGFSTVHPRCCINIYLGQFAFRTGPQCESHA